MRDMVWWFRSSVTLSVLSRELLTPLKNRSLFSECANQRTPLVNYVFFFSLDLTLAFELAVAHSLPTRIDNSSVISLSSFFWGAAGDGGTPFGIGTLECDPPLFFLRSKEGLTLSPSSPQGEAA